MSILKSTPERMIVLVCVFLMSVLTLMLELVQTRIFSVLYWNHLVYFIVTISLLGIAVSGTVLSVSKKIRTLPKETFYTFCLAGFSISSLLGLFIIAKIPIDLLSFWDNPLINILGLLLSYSFAMVPYVFFGLLIAGTFIYYPGQSGTTYFVNLLGSALGCLFYIVLIKPLGGNGLILLIFLLGILPLFFYLRKQHRLIIYLIAASILITADWGRRAIQILPDKNKQYWTYFENRQVEFSQWNAISRVDVLSERGEVDKKLILIDGDAQTPLKNANVPFVDTSLRELVYHIKGDKVAGDVLVIGPGGGVDVIFALRNHAKTVNAVEINPTTADIVSTRFSDYIGNIFSRENVKLHVDDGRSFVRRSDRKYDVIMMFAVDTLGALSTGAYVLSENYLYTLNAFSDYWRHLKDDGMIQIARWHFNKFPRETFRVFTTAYEALALNGVAEPFRHLLVIGDKRTDFAGIIISKRPFTNESLPVILKWLERNQLYPLFAATDEVIELNGDSVFNQFAIQAENGMKEEFYQDYIFNVKPVTDDSPFFFQYGRWSHVFKAYPIMHEYFNSVIGKWPFLTLLALIVQAIILVTLLVWLPLLKLKRGRIKGTKHVPVVIYFALLGIAFMFIEISMIQKLVLLLGHPVYSMAVTIPTILVSAGIGSLYSDFSKAKGNVLIMIAILALCTLIGGWVLMSTAISEAVLAKSITARVVASIMLLFPIGFLMGIPFPLGIRSLSNRPEMIPIAWASNGGMSVIGSVIAIVLAMQYGFSFVAVIAAGLYLCAMFCFNSLLKAQEN
ncbi:MAG: spermine/spermidine synthase domain-containing protein [Planctomycetota bacterium]|jgi:spermidine synthase